MIVQVVMALAVVGIAGFVVLMARAIEQERRRQSGPPDRHERNDPPRRP